MPEARKMSPTYSEGDPAGAVRVVESNIDNIDISDEDAQEYGFASAEEAKDTLKTNVVAKVQIAYIQNGILAYLEKIATGPKKRGDLYAEQEKRAHQAMRLLISKSQTASEDNAVLIDNLVVTFQEEKTRAAKKSASVQKDAMRDWLVANGHNAQEAVQEIAAIAQAIVDNKPPEPLRAQMDIQTLESYVDDLVKKAEVEAKASAKQEEARHPIHEGAFIDWLKTTWGRIKSIIDKRVNKTKALNKQGHIMFDKMQYSNWTDDAKRMMKAHLNIRGM